MYLSYSMAYTLCLCYFQQDCEDEEAHSEGVRQYEAGLESSYQEQCVLALEDKKKTLNRVMNEKENGEKVPTGIINGETKANLILGLFIFIVYTLRCIYHLFESLESLHYAFFYYK